MEAFGKEKKIRQGKIKKIIIIIIIISIVIIIIIIIIIIVVVYSNAFYPHILILGSRMK